MRFPKRTRMQLFLVVLSGFALLCAEASLAQKKRYRKATEDDDEVVKNKLYPKKTKVELGAPDFGGVLNQSYINTFVVHGGISYYWSEEWGLSLEGLYALNSDKSERYCIEHFYNDPLQEVGPPCPAEGQEVDNPLIESVSANKTSYNPRANFGPAYVGIREISSILTASAVWTPVYGKQLAFMASTLYLDLFFNIGAGVTMSTYYPKSLFLKYGDPPYKSRQDVDTNKLEDPAYKACDPGTLGGVCPDHPDRDTLIGLKGRPAALSLTTPTLTFGIGQKFHFAERFHIKAEFRNYTLLDSDNGYDTFFMIWGGLGVRL